MWTAERAGAATPGSVLLTSPGMIPGRADVPSDLIALVHLNADGHSGAVVSIPAGSLVRVPGYAFPAGLDHLTAATGCLRCGGPM